MSSISISVKSRTSKKNETSAKARKFVYLLKDIEIENTFNPYLHICPIHDHIKSSAIRERNLTQYMEFHLTSQSKILWLGRDLGYRGGRRTGIPLTDEVHLVDLTKALHSPAFVKATKTDAAKERTATEIWKLANHFLAPPFMWNVFPFHPYDEDDPMSNRSHSKDEFDETKCILEEVLNLFEFEYFFALGRDAYNVLFELGVKPVYVRHPSHGGQFQFRKTIIEQTPKNYAAFGDITV